MHCPGLAEIGLGSDVAARADSSEQDFIADTVRRRSTAIQVPASEAAGPVWARHICFSMFKGEERVLSIDAHMRFRRGWDLLLERDLTGAQAMLGGGVSETGHIGTGGLCVISTYPAAYDPTPGKAVDTSAACAVP